MTGTEIDLVRRYPVLWSKLTKHLLSALRWKIAVGGASTWRGRRRLLALVMAAGLTANWGAGRSVHDRIAEVDPSRKFAGAVLAEARELPGVSYQPNRQSWRSSAVVDFHGKPQSHLLLLPRTLRGDYGGGVDGYLFYREPWTTISDADSISFRRCVGGLLGGFGGCLGGGDLFLAGAPQHISGSDQQARNDHQSEGKSRTKRIRDLQSDSVEYRPELGSLIAAIISLGGAFLLPIPGWSFWDGGRRYVGGLLLGLSLLLGAEGTFGLLLGFDFWRLWRFWGV